MNKKEDTIIKDRLYERSVSLSVLNIKAGINNNMFIAIDIINPIKYSILKIIISSNKKPALLGGFFVI